MTQQSAGGDAATSSPLDKKSDVVPKLTNSNRGLEKLGSDVPLSQSLIPADPKRLGNKSGRNSEHRVYVQGINVNTSPVS